MSNFYLKKKIMSSLKTCYFYNLYKSLRYWVAIEKINTCT